MFITATELKTNIGKYLSLASKEDIIITKNGKSIAKLTNINEELLQFRIIRVGIWPDR